MQRLWIVLLSTVIIISLNIPLLGAQSPEKNLTYTLNGCNACISIETYRATAAGTPIILALEGSTVKCTMDAQGNVFSRKLDPQRHEPPVFEIDQLSFQLRLENNTFPISVYETNLLRTRVMISQPRIQLPLRLSENGKEGILLFGKLEVPVRFERDDKLGSVAVKKGSNAGLTGAIPTTEREALIALYNATHGDVWYNNSGWKRPPLDTDSFALPGTEGSWAGVEVVSDHVVSIDLWYNSLYGPLPSQLGDLSYLTYLDLSQNELTGSIPTQMGNLTNLQILNLSSNTLTGSIPTELGNLSNLQRLQLSSNTLSGSIPSQLGNLTLLLRLNLNNNQLTGNIPTQLGAMTSLQYLNLSNNQLTGGIPTELGNLANLNALYLYFNQLSGSIPTELSNLANLLSLDISNNQFTGTIPTALANITTLTRLELYANQLSGTLPPELGNLVNMQRLDLSANQFTGTIPVELKNMTNLGYLNLSANQLSGSIPTELGSLVNLYGLYLHSNRLNGSIPSELGDCVLMQYLELDCNNLTGAVPTALTGLTILNTLDIDYNGLYSTDSGLTAFLDAKNPGWSGTQTVAPTGILADWNSETTVLIEWDVIAYTNGTGGYRVYYSTTPGGPYSFYGQTADKTVSSMQLEGLDKSNLYYFFIIKTVTDAHDLQQNSVLSDPSAEYFLSNAPRCHVQFIAGPGGSLSGDTDQYVYAGGGPCTPVTAVPNPGYYFVDWTGSYTGTENPLTITTVSADMTITANFSPITAADDRARLILLYNSTNGDTWNDNSGWKTPPLHTDGFALPGTEGSWFGVTASAGTVTEIHLYSNNLTGGLIPQLGDMANLQLLYLSSNNLTGAIPVELAGATNLRVLDLSHNQLTGTIPVELGSLSKLEYLDLNSNQLTGAIPTELSALTNLYGLSLFSNSLSGEIPFQLGNLAKLESLYLCYNQLTGSIPPELGNLSSLRTLELQSNQLTGSFPLELGNLTGLQSLDLSSNQVTGGIPVQLGNLTALEGLYLRENRLTGNIPSQLGNCSALRTLNLESNGLKGPLPETLLLLSNLSYLDIEYNALYPTSAEMEAFLDLWNYGWKRTQTLAPTDVQATVVSSSSIDLTWTPIEYTDESGGYRIFYANASGGPYTFYRQTADKYASSIRFTGLKPGPYYFIIRTQTNAHGTQANPLESDNSQEAACNTKFINLTSPNGGETWQIGSGKTITWNSSGMNCFCRLELWNGASKVGVIARKVPVTDGSYYWMAGNCSGVIATPGSGYLVKIIPNVPSYSDISDSGFTLDSQPYIKVKEPSGGDVVPIGSSRVITWLYSEVSGSCSIELWKDGVGKVGTIVSNYSVSFKSYLWTVGQYQGGTAAAGPGYKIKIIADSGPSDTIDGSFTIVNPPTLTITSPNGGETWISGNIQAITWSSSDVGSSALCSLELYKDNVRLGNIASGLSLADGTYSWTVGQYIGGTAPVGNDYKVRIAILGDGREDRSDLSNTNFTIE